MYDRRFRPEPKTSGICPNKIILNLIAAASAQIAGRQLRKRFFWRQNRIFRRETSQENVLVVHLADADVLPMWRRMQTHGDLLIDSSWYSLYVIWTRASHFFFPLCIQVVPYLPMDLLLLSSSDYLSNTTRQPCISNALMKILCKAGGVQRNDKVGSNVPGGLFNLLLVVPITFERLTFGVSEFERSKNAVSLGVGQVRRFFSSPSSTNPKKCIILQPSQLYFPTSGVGPHMTPKSQRRTREEVPIFF